jgi:hypothetical protein
MFLNTRSLPALFAVATVFGAINICCAQTKATKPASPAAGAKPDSDKGPEAVLYVPGAYQDWKPATAPKIAAVPGSPSRYEGYVNFTGTGEQPFKFTDAPDWTHTNYGSGPGGTLSADGQAAGLTVPAGGYYELTADLGKSTWTATKTTWSVIGNATPGGWEKDTAMTYDPEKQVWTVTLPMKADGSFKFRANDAWKIDLGLDKDGKLQYVDNPFFDYNAKIKDLTVPDDGTYTLTLDLHVPGKYTFSIEAK